MMHPGFQMGFGHQCRTYQVRLLQGHCVDQGAPRLQAQPLPGLALRQGCAVGRVELQARQLHSQCRIWATRQRLPLPRSQLHIHGTAVHSRMLAFLLPTRLEEGTMPQSCKPNENKISETRKPETQTHELENKLPGRSRSGRKRPRQLVSCRRGRLDKLLRERLEKLRNEQRERRRSKQLEKPMNEQRERHRIELEKPRNEQLKWPQRERLRNEHCERLKNEQLGRLRSVQKRRQQPGTRKPRRRKQQLPPSVLLLVRLKNFAERKRRPKSANRRQRLLH
mmetsp:Transcript_12797/g.22658  ORF Transcript_12797/g.22658 Transcript_12797/m.22658 type:complete len:280 (+) Transcript_12797:741-1580(+)